MPHYKLLYFDIRGRGEAIRLLLHISGENFDDHRIGMESWGAIKNTMPLGQLPVLEVDGVQIAQTQAIARYLGHQLRRAGRNAVECARLDMIGECVQEFINAPGYSKYGAVLLGLIPADKVQYYRENVIPDIDKYAPIIEKFLVENGNNGLFIGDRESWVDVFAAETFVKLVDYGSPGALDAYPHILALINRVFNHRNIKKYLATRKPSPA